jgi:hypothetical protein
MPLVARLAGRMGDADRAPETSRLRPREDEVDVGDAERTEILPSGRAKRRLEHPDSPILEVEPPRELGAQLRRRLERLDLPLLRADEGEDNANSGDHVRRFGDVGWPDPVELWSVNAADRRHPSQVLRLCRLGSRVGAEDEDERDRDSGGQGGAGCAEERAPTSQRSHHW